MTTYAEDRAIRTSDAYLAWRGKSPHLVKVLNNTGNSRQVRRARERDRERIVFSDRLVRALDQIEWGPGNTPPMGLFNYSPISPTIRRRVKRYRAAYLSERMEPSADYSRRYQALFAMPESPAVHKG